MKINIGCGREYRRGWLNTDISRATKADAHFDVRTEPIPCDTDNASEIFISGVLEQIAENEHLIYAMNECHRVLKPGSIMTVIVPNARYAIAHQDPMDIRKFTRETFSYFQKGARQHDLYGSVYGFAGWSDIRIEENARHILTVTMTK